MCITNPGGGQLRCLQTTVRRVTWASRRNDEVLALHDAKDDGMDVHVMYRLSQILLNQFRTRSVLGSVQAASGSQESSRAEQVSSAGRANDRSEELTTARTISQTRYVLEAICICEFASSSQTMLWLFTGADS